MKPHLNDMEEATDMSAAGALEEKASETIINLSKPSVRDSKETVACCDSPLNKHSDYFNLRRKILKKQFSIVSTIRKPILKNSKAR